MSLKFLKYFIQVYVLVFSIHRLKDGVDSIWKFSVISLSNSLHAFAALYEKLLLRKFVFGLSRNNLVLLLRKW